MNALLYWLRVGLAAYLAFFPPEVQSAHDGLVLSLETRRALTAEMEDLVAGGVTLDFELYCSLKAEKEGGGSVVAIRKLKRSIGYDYVNDVFTVTEGGTTLAADADLSRAEAALKRYGGLGFAVPPDWVSAEFFAELRPLDNRMLRDRFGKSGASLWNGYRPSVKLKIARSEIESAEEGP